VISLLSLGAWAADTWFVPDRSHAEVLEDALASQWPGRAAEVVVGPAPADAPGARWDGLELVVVAPDQVRAAPAETATDAVLLARTWTLPADPLGGDVFLPELPLEPIVDEGHPENPSAAGPVRDLQLGVGLREALFTANSGVRLVGGYNHRRNTFELVGFVPVGTAWQVDHLANPDDDGAVWADRATLGLLIGRAWALERGNYRGAYRVAVGPELGWVERWRLRDAWRRTATAGLEPAALVSGGFSCPVGPVDLVLAQLFRVSFQTGPILESATTLDVRVSLPRRREAVATGPG
jgi:hypothetical protein